MKKVFLSVICCFAVICVMAGNKDSLLLVKATWNVYTLSQGVILKKVHFKNREYMNSNQHICVLEVQANATSCLEFAYAPNGDYTSAMAKKKNALAAVNGSFFDMDRMNPICFLRIDGKDVGENTNKNTPYRKYYQYGTLVLTDDGMPRILKTDSLRVWEKSLKYTNVMTAGPLLIYNGSMEPMRDDRTFVTNRHNRTALGIRKDGSYIILAVDGRFSQANGMSLNELSKTLKWLGCVYAINMDGGGSTTCYVQGHGIVNYPSDNGRFDSAGERKVSNAILLLPTVGK